jgi:hypothetical protein
MFRLSNSVVFWDTLKEKYEPNLILSLATKLAVETANNNVACSSVSEGYPLARQTATAKIFKCHSERS